MTIETTGLTVRQGLIIRLLERGDLEAARIMHNDETTLLRLSDPRHVSELEQDAWYSSICMSKTLRRYSVIEKETSEFTGLFRIDQLDIINRSCCVGLDIVQEKRGKGYAKIIYNYFFEYLFENLGLNRLYLLTLDDNEVAKNLYVSLGFKQEGVQKEAIFRGGLYHDLVQMSILQSDYSSNTCK